MFASSYVEKRIRSNAQTITFDMSLVDSGYGSDEDEDLQDANEADGLRDLQSSHGGAPSASVSEPSSTTAMAIARQSEQESYGRSVSNPADSSSQLRLPDVSEIFGPSSSEAAADSQKKRPAVNGIAHLMPHTKLPRGTLMPSRIRPDTAGGLLTPPQIRGRSNVATEDLEKIFSRRLKR